MPVQGICGCRINRYQYFIVLGSRFLYIFEPKNIRRSVLCTENRFHSWSLPFWLIVAKFIPLWKLAPSGSVKSSVERGLRFGCRGVTAHPKKSVVDGATARHQRKMYRQSIT